MYNRIRIDYGAGKWEPNHPNAKKRGGIAAGAD